MATVDKCFQQQEWKHLEVVNYSYKKATIFLHNTNLNSSYRHNCFWHVCYRFWEDISHCQLQDIEVCSYHKYLKQHQS